MKRLLLWIFIILLLLVLTGYCIYRYRPDLLQRLAVPELRQVEKAEARIARDTAFTNLYLTVRNDGWFKMNIDSLYFNVRFDTLRVLTGDQKLDLILDIGESDTLAMPVAIPFRTLLDMIADGQDQDSVDIATDVRIVYRTIFGKRAIPYEKVDRIGMPLPPEFDLGKVRFAGMKNRKILLDAEISMNNPGNLRLVLSDLAFEFRLADAMVATGSHPDTLNILPRSRLKRTLRIEAKLDKPLKSAFAFASKKKDTPFHAVVTGKLHHDDLGDKPTKITIEKSGKL
jgi:hypothetical protein